MESKNRIARGMITTTIFQLCRHSLLNQSNAVLHQREDTRTGPSLILPPQLSTDLVLIMLRNRKHHHAHSSCVTDTGFPLLAMLLVINDLMNDPFRLRISIIGFSLRVLFFCVLVFKTFQPF